MLGPPVVDAQGGDQGQPPAWIVNVLWCSLYSGWAWMQESGASRHDALELLLRSLEGAVRPRD